MHTVADAFWTGQVSDTLEDKRAEMEAAATREDYNAAILARDACHQLELQQRSLQLSLDEHQRSTVLHHLGEAKPASPGCIQASLCCSKALHLIRKVSAQRF